MKWKNLLFVAMLLAAMTGCVHHGFQTALRRIPEGSIQSGKTLPVVLVRGFISNDKFLAPLEKAIRQNGVTQIRYPEFTSRWGSDGVDKMAAQIAEAVAQLKAETNSEKVDLVAYSFGALAARYYVQRLGGKNHVRKFISLAGTHSGTIWSYVGYFQPGVRDMALNSSIIQDLDKDADPFGDMQVYSFYTPYDLVVIPYTSSIIKGSTQTTAFPVALHHRFVKDPLVLKEVCYVLNSSDSPGEEYASR